MYFDTREKIAIVTNKTSLFYITIFKKHICKITPILGLNIALQRDKKLQNCFILTIKVHRFKRCQKRKC